MLPRAGGGGALKAALRKNNSVTHQYMEISEQVERKNRTERKGI